MEKLIKPIARRKFLLHGSAAALGTVLVDTLGQDVASASSTAVVRLKTLQFGCSSCPSRVRFKAYINGNLIGSPVGVDCGSTYDFPSGSDSSPLNVPFAHLIACEIKDLDNDVWFSGQSTTAVSSNQSSGSVTIACTIPYHTCSLTLSYRIID